MIVIVQSHLSNPRLDNASTCSPELMFLIPSITKTDSTHIIKKGRKKCPISVEFRDLKIRAPGSGSGSGSGSGKCRLGNPLVPQPRPCYLGRVPPLRPARAGESSRRPYLPVIFHLSCAFSAALTPTRLM